MSKRSLRKSLKAVSPVIATIIIVSVAIVMSIAVAYWMLGMGSAFTRYEKLEFVSAYATAQGSEYVINVKISNTGSAALSLAEDGLFLNGKPAEAYVVNGTGTVQVSWTEISLEPGEKTEETITLTKSAGSPWQSGMTVEVVLRTGSGGEYPKSVVLP